MCCNQPVEIKKILLCPQIVLDIIVFWYNVRHEEREGKFHVIDLIYKVYKGLSTLTCHFCLVSAMSP